jgi:cardiolipin synthase
VGKASTVAQVAYIGLVLLLLAMNLEIPGLMFAGAVAVAFFTLWSFLAYAIVWLQAVAAGHRAA